MINILFIDLKNPEKDKLLLSGLLDRMLKEIPNESCILVAVPLKIFQSDMIRTVEGQYKNQDIKWVVQKGDELYAIYVNKEDED